MEKHVRLAGILNIVYRGLSILGAGVLFLLAMVFGRLFESLIWSGQINSRDVPIEVLNIVPIILVCVAIVICLISIAGIIAAVGVLKHKEWARILLLVISFFHLLHIPLGTVLGGYSIWVLMNDETIRLCNPVAVGTAVPPAA
jgi:hypothetical protein